LAHLHTVSLAAIAGFFRFAPCPGGCEAQHVVIVGGANPTSMQAMVREMFCLCGGFIRAGVILGCSNAVLFKHLKKL